MSRSEEYVSGAPSRVAGYYRVSTGKQAENDLSIPDQKRWVSDFSAGQGWTVSEEFVDAKSGTNGNRPGLQRMLAIVESGRADFDVVLVHSYSRFFRNPLEAMNFIEALRKHGIEIVSITQPVPRGPMGDMVRCMFMIFDEHQSSETSKHVGRSLRENARQGYWNGGRPPYGYTTAAAGTRGNTIKKKLVIDPIEATHVAQMFDLYLKGDGTSGPLGVKGVTCWLNDQGSRTRGGARWGIGAVHKILTNQTLTGAHMFGRGVEGVEPVPMEVPRIIPEATFDAAQRTLRANNPKKTPPRVTTGPILLSGLATCGCCGAAMTTRTGKGGRYRYYTCGSRIRIGVDSCAGRSVPMDNLDQLVTDHVVRQLLPPGRMKLLLEGLIKRQTDRDGRKSEHLAQIREKHADAEMRLKRYYDAIEAGILDTSDQTLKERIAGVKTERDIAKVAMERAAVEISPSARINEEKIAAFSQIMRENIVNGTIQFRRSYLRAILKEVRIKEKSIEIVGRKSDLERAVLTTKGRDLSVPSFVPGWRSGGNWDPTLSAP